jgi:hypothetical protein
MNWFYQAFSAQSNPVRVLNSNRVALGGKDLPAFQFLIASKLWRF